MASPDTVRPLNSDLQRYVQERVVPAVEAIPEERREALDLLAEFVQEQRTVNGSKAYAHLTFICTHNSRRSHMSQIWAATAAYYHGQDHVRTYSGGTEATAFNPRAVAALQRAGFHIERPEGQNPHYAVSFTQELQPLECWSKVYDDPSNPGEGFCAVMTCSHADTNCPIVRGAADRISIPYEDPKEADGTDAETESYDDRCLRIAAEMWYVMQQASR